MKYFLVAALILIAFGCSSAQTDTEITNKIIQLIENEPHRWVTIETLRTLTYDYKSSDEKEQITLQIWKKVPVTAVMLSPYKVEFSPDTSAKLESEFEKRYWQRLKKNKKV